MPIPTPPRPLQSEIVRSIEHQLDACTRLENETHMQEQRSVQLRRALLAAAFSGRLTGRSTDTEVVEELAAEQEAS